MKPPICHKIHWLFMLQNGLSIVICLAIWKWKKSPVHRQSIPTCFENNSYIIAGSKILPHLNCRKKINGNKLHTEIEHKSKKKETAILISIKNGVHGYNEQKTFPLNSHFDRIKKHETKSSVCILKTSNEISLTLVMN